MGLGRQSERLYGCVVRVGGGKAHIVPMLRTPRSL